MPSINAPQGKKLLQRRLLAWYQRNQRRLPWRESRDPYRVWLSEIMLQQTRVAAVIGYYERFLTLFPTVHDLAAAAEPEVLAAWSGLGYYRRARMLHAAAKQVCSALNGSFPSNTAELMRLPGIGRYTSAAIASICFGEPAPVVDGNVERVLQRIVAGPLAGEKVWKLAAALLDEDQAGDFNQAVMELGGTVCLPKAPACLVCPLVEFCRTRGAGEARPHNIRRKREIHYALNMRRERVLLVQRSAEESLMPGMWELPETDSKEYSAWLTLRHSITVTDYTVRVIKDARTHGTGKWVENRLTNALPLTGLARKILRAAEIL